LTASIASAIDVYEYGSDDVVVLLPNSREVFEREKQATTTRSGWLQSHKHLSKLGFRVVQNDPGIIDHQVLWHSVLGYLALRM
jgi:hypothetical protein